MALAFVDVETTGLDISVHEVWEIGLIVDEAEYTYRIAPFVKNASPDALRITRFYERTSDPEWKWDASPGNTAHEVARLTSGRHLVGAVPSFDALFLTKFLARWAGIPPAWHYHLVDVEALAAGKLGIAPPWNTHELAERLGVANGASAHEALADARWAKEMYDAVVKNA